jgi:hypothetical protein
MSEESIFRLKQAGLDGYIGIVPDKYLIQILHVHRRKGLNGKRVKVFLNDKGICQLCKLPLNSYEDLSVDHKIPVRWGGSHELSNLQTAHKQCNQIRGANPMDYYKPEDYISRDKRFIIKNVLIDLIFCIALAVFTLKILDGVISDLYRGYLTCFSIYIAILVRRMLHYAVNWRGINKYLYKLRYGKSNFTH